MQDCFGFSRLVILSEATEESQKARCFAALSMTNMLEHPEKIFGKPYKYLLTSHRIAHPIR
jgi:hypothetical protein